MLSKNINIHFICLNKNKKVSLIKIRNANIKKFGNSFYLNVPKSYVDDGNLSLSKEYDIVLSESSEDGGSE